MSRQTLDKRNRPPKLADMNRDNLLDETPMGVNDPAFNLKVTKAETRQESEFDWGERTTVNLNDRNRKTVNDR